MIIREEPMSGWISFLFIMLAALKSKAKLFIYEIINVQLN
jgi:hypothetical protein